MIITRFYRDIFDEKFMLNRIENASQERYVEMIRGTNGVYVESWEDGFGKALAIAYPEEDYFNPPMHDAIYNAMCNNNKFKPRKLRYVVLPESMFDEVVRILGLCEGGQS